MKKIKKQQKRFWEPIVPITDFDKWMMLAWLVVVIIALILVIFRSK